MNNQIIVCHACDALQKRATLAAGAKAQCMRCGIELYRSGSPVPDWPIALGCSALVLLYLSNAFPLVQLKLNGTTRAATLLDAATGLYQQGFSAMALLVFLTTIVVPCMQVVLVLHVLIWSKLGWRLQYGVLEIRLLGMVRPWAMIEVFMLGSLVALVKLSALAEVIPGTALYACGALMVVLTALSNSASPRQLWRYVR